MEGLHAHAVLTDVFVLCHIVVFQSGLPRDLIELASTCPEDDRFPAGFLPMFAIQNGHLALLQRLYRYYQEQASFRFKIFHLGRWYVSTLMSFVNVWEVALLSGHLPIVEWLDTQPKLRGEKLPASCTVELAFESRSCDVVTWLLTKRPQYKTEVSEEILENVVAQGDLKLYEWLETNVVNLRTTQGVVLRTADMAKNLDTGTGPTDT